MHVDRLKESFVLGDPTAVAAVGRLVRRVVGDRGYWIPRDERDDVVQEAVVRVYQAVSLPAFRLDHGFDSYVRTVAHHACVDWLRRHRPTDEIDPNREAPGDGPADDLVARERRSRGRRILRMLGPACLRLIRLRVRDRLAHREIAERLGRTEGGVRNHLYKCLQRARAIARRLDGRSGDDLVGPGD